MRALPARTAFLAGLLLSLAAHLPPANAAAPSCSGRDLAAELATKDPAAWSGVEAKAKATVNGDAILWRIAGRGVAPSYLFGTIHLTDERVTTLSPTVVGAIDAARKVALEVADLSPQALGASIARLQYLLVYTDGRSLNQYLDAAEQAIAARSLERAGMPGAALAALKPWVVTMTMSLSDCERQRTAAGHNALDLQIGERARQRGIPVAGLETMEDQLRAMAAVPDADQLTVLKASLRLFDLTDDMIETMVRRYVGREIGHVWPLQEAIWRRAGFEPWAFASFQRELVTVRNIKMRDAALPLIAEGGAFIAVGALHLPGEQGLVELLRKSGLSIEKVE